MASNQKQKKPAKVRPAGLPTRQQVMDFIAEADTPAGKREIAKAFGLKGQEKIALKALLKDMEPEDLLDRIKEAAEGKLVISPQLAAILAGIVSGGRAAPADALSSLTSRELDILRALARGMSNKMIAKRLDITEGTVKVHVKNLLRKLGLRSRVEAAVRAHPSKSNLQNWGPQLLTKLKA